MAGMNTSDNITDEWSGYSSDVQAVIDMFGPVDLQANMDLEIPRFSDSKFRWHRIEDTHGGALIGGDPATIYERAAFATPSNYISDKMAPILILHGDNDPLVPPSASSDLLYDAICKAGMEDRCDYYMIHHAGHGTREFLNESGYETYEISNSCMPGYRSIHNSSYWNSCEYFAIGAGAHGYLSDMRYGHRDDVRAYIEEMNTITPDMYKAFLEGNKSGLKSLYTEEMLSREDKMREVAFLRLRTTDGILLDEFRKVFGEEFENVFAREVEDNIKKGLLERKERTLRLTRSGLDLANKVIEDFL